MALELRGMTPLIQVFDMPTSIAFYREVLGFEVVHSAPPGDEWDWVMLRRQGVELMLNTAYEKPSRPPSPDAERSFAHSDTCLYFGCPDLDAAYAHLQAAGVAVNPPTIAPYGMKQLYVTDPDGYNLCFQWPV